MRVAGVLWLPRDREIIRGTRTHLKPANFLSSPR
jgi:hypothetical protein